MLLKFYLSEEIFITFDYERPYINGAGEELLPNIFEIHELKNVKVEEEKIHERLIEESQKLESEMFEKHENSDAIVKSDKSHRSLMRDFVENELEIEV